MKDPNQTLRARVLTNCRTGFIVGAINLDELFPEKYFYIDCDNRHSCLKRFAYKMQLFMSLNTKYQCYNLEEQIMCCLEYLKPHVILSGRTRATLRFE